MEEYIYPLLNLLNEMSPYLLFGFFIAGVLHEFVPRRIYADKLSGNNFRSVFWATMFGIPLPLCSCGVIPTAASLRREGASKGATVSFLIATPQTGVDSILATASVLGIPFAVIRPLVALVTAMAGGWAVNRWCGDDAAESNAPQHDEKKKGFWQKCIGTLRYGFIEMLQDIGKWIVIGLIIAAIITVAVPEGFFSQFSGYPILSMLIILALTTPMYLCATGSIPIAAALMLKGLSPGAALVLLMAGPATNMAAILVINKVLGRKPLIIYLITIIAGAMGFGLFIDYALPADWFTGAAALQNGGCCHAEDAPWWQTASSIIFIVLLAVAFILKFIKKGECNCSHDDGCSRDKAQSFRIEGMMCNHCRENVEKSLRQLDGVEDVHVDLDKGTAYVKGEDIDRDKVIATINSLGYRYIPEERG